MIGQTGIRACLNDTDKVFSCKGPWSCGYCIVLSFIPIVLHIKYLGKDYGEVSSSVKKVHEYRIKISLILKHLLCIILRRNWYKVGDISSNEMRMTSTARNSPFLLY